jgi:hypothetical protein
MQHDVLLFGGELSVSSKRPTSHAAAENEMQQKLFSSAEMSQDNR